MSQTKREMLIEPRPLSEGEWDQMLAELAFLDLLQNQIKEEETDGE